MRWYNYCSRCMYDALTSSFPSQASTDLPRAAASHAAVVLMPRFISNGWRIVTEIMDVGISLSVPLKARLLLHSVNCPRTCWPQPTQQELMNFGDFRRFCHDESHKTALARHMALANTIVVAKGTHRRTHQLDCWGCCFSPQTGLLKRDYPASGTVWCLLQVYGSGCVEHTLHFDD